MAGTARHRGKRQAFVTTIETLGNRKMKKLPRCPHCKPRPVPPSPRQACVDGRSAGSDHAWGPGDRRGAARSALPLLTSAGQAAGEPGFTVVEHAGSLSSNTLGDVRPALTLECRCGGHEPSLDPARCRGQCDNRYGSDCHATVTSPENCRDMIPQRCIRTAGPVPGGDADGGRLERRRRDRHRIV